MFRRSLSLGLCVVFVAAAGVATQNASAGIDYAMYSEIRDEGLNRSQVMDHVSLAERRLRSAAAPGRRPSSRRASGR